MPVALSASAPLFRSVTLSLALSPETAPPTEQAVHADDNEGAEELPPQPDSDSIVTQARNATEQLRRFCLMMISVHFSSSCNPQQRHSGESLSPLRTADHFRCIHRPPLAAGRKTHYCSTQSRTRMPAFLATLPASAPLRVYRDVRMRANMGPAAAGFARAHIAHENSIRAPRQP